MSSLEVEYRDVTAEQREALAKIRWLRARAWAAVRGVSFATERRVKAEMPVDYGRARAGWGHWTVQDLRPGAVEVGATRQDAVWEENEEQLSLTQGTNVPYTEELNAGHSRQAPRGFIDRAEEAALRLLDNAVDEIFGAF